MKSGKKIQPHKSIQNKKRNLKKIAIKRMRIKIKIKNKLDENYNFFNRW
jgi:hypothetical protein